MVHGRSNGRVSRCVSPLSGPARGQAGQADCVVALLDGGAQVDQQGGLGPAWGGAGGKYRGGMTALHWAAAGGATEAVKALLDRGAQV